MRSFLFAKVAATVRAMRDELPTVPAVIAKIVGEYIVSLTWEEAGKRLIL
jgi:hypothetical protein